MGWVVDKAAWDEALKKNVYVCKNCRDHNCKRCEDLGITQFEYDTAEELDAHQYACQDDCADNGKEGVCTNSTKRYDVVYGYIHHDEEGHYETITIVDKEAWDEQVIDHYECDCGETK